jgi:hypothetical protein
LTIEMIISSESLENRIEFELRVQGWGSYPPLPPPVAAAIKSHLNLDESGDWERYLAVDLVAALHLSIYRSHAPRKLPSAEDITRAIELFRLL